MQDRETAEAQLLLGQWIARWRAQVGVSQRKLASMAGIDQGGLSRVERGLQLLGHRRLAGILLALDDLGDLTPMGRLPPPLIRPRPERGVPRLRPDGHRGRRP
jgi:transcriptional regulator with XRE-family HTH domain